MDFAKVYKDDLLIVEKVELAESFVKRFLGLMFRKNLSENHGLLLTPCNEIHTFSMRFPIDAIFLDHEGKVLKIETAMQPNKLGKKVKQANSVLELRAHTAENLGLSEGDILNIVKP